MAYTPIYLKHLRDARAVERATIPVENIRGPVLLVSGADDQMWPSSDLADIAMRRLESKELSQLSVPAFEIPRVRVISSCCRMGREQRTSSVSRPKVLAACCYTQGGTPKADAEAGADAWRQMLEFLEAGVKSRR